MNLRTVAGTVVWGFSYGPLSQLAPAFLLVLSSGAV